MRNGVRLGVDVGRARIGVARCDDRGLLATPVETVPRITLGDRGTAAGRRGQSSGAAARRGQSKAPDQTKAPGQTAASATDAHADVERIAQLADEFEAIEIVVGLPVSLSGAHTASTDDALEFARLIAARMPQVSVRMVDERLSTVSAQHALHASGKKARGSRPVIDQVAAVIILQQALDSERASGTPPGSAIPPSEGS